MDSSARLASVPTATPEASECTCPEPCHIDHDND
jgi:hypothetical protein